MSRWQQTTTPQERAAAAVPALRRGADNEQWCCCQDDVSDNERASGNGSIAVAGTRVAGAPGASRAVFLSHTSRCIVKFPSVHGGGRGREVCSPASWRCVPRRVSASAKARRPVALSTSGGLGRYWAAQWHLARAVGKRFRGCRAKRLYVHSCSPNSSEKHPQPNLFLETRVFLHQPQGDHASGPVLFARLILI